MCVLEYRCGLHADRVAVDIVSFDSSVCVGGMWVGEHVVREGSVRVCVQCECACECVYVCVRV